MGDYLRKTLYSTLSAQFILGILQCIFGYTWEGILICIFTGAGLLSWPCSFGPGKIAYTIYVWVCSGFFIWRLSDMGKRGESNPLKWIIDLCLLVTFFLGTFLATREYFNEHGFGLTRKTEESKDPLLGGGSTLGSGSHV